jgi:FdhD protein
LKPGINMEDEAEKFTILQITPAGRSNTEAVIAREFPVTIILNGKELVTMLCSPKDMDCLAVGFLASEGLLKSKNEIKNILVDAERGVVRVETTEDKPVGRDMFTRVISSAGSRGTSVYSPDAASQKIESPMKVKADEASKLAEQFQNYSELHRVTRGVHSAALCDNKSILVFSDDIGRHNAIDKVFGKCLLENIPTNDRIMITSGRVSSEILHKMVKRDIPIVITIAVPTNIGVRIANNLGITLIGSLKDSGSLNVYTNDWRVL